MIVYQRVYQVLYQLHPPNSHFNGKHLAKCWLTDSEGCDFQINPYVAYVDDDIRPWPFSLLPRRCTPRLWLWGSENWVSHSIHCQHHHFSYKNGHNFHKNMQLSGIVSHSLPLYASYIPLIPIYFSPSLVATVLTNVSPPRPVPWCRSVRSWRPKRRRRSDRPRDPPPWPGADRAHGGGFHRGRMALSKWFKTLHGLIHGLKWI